MKMKANRQENQKIASDAIENGIGQQYSDNLYTGCRKSMSAFFKHKSAKNI